MLKSNHEIRFRAALSLIRRLIDAERDASTVVIWFGARKVLTPEEIATLAYPEIPDEGERFPKIM
jgi:hypothetical protein